MGIRTGSITGGSDFIGDDDEAEDLIRAGDDDNVDHLWESGDGDPECSGGDDDEVDAFIGGGETI